MFNTILVGIDGSDDSLTGARFAALLAKRTNACLASISVFDPSLYSPSFSGAWELYGEPVRLDRIQSDTYDECERRAQMLFDSEGVRCQLMREEGHPAERIVRTAREIEADVIVLGSRGQGRWEALALGSVSASVLRHAPCPVFVARGKEPSLDKILLATDGSDSAGHATTIAIDLVRLFRGELTVLNVCRSLKPVDREAKQSLGSRAQERILEFVAGTVDQLIKEGDISPVIRQEVGHPAEIITHIAKTERFDLIVMGSRGMGGFGSLLLGSVSDQVARHASCSVLVAR